MLRLALDAMVSFSDLPLRLIAWSGAAAAVSTVVLARALWLVAGGAAAGWPEVAGLVNSPVLYFEADRPLGCRFVFANYLTGASPATATQTDGTVDTARYIVREAWPMLERDLAERQPCFLVDGSPGDVAFYGKYPPWKFPRLTRVLDCAYDAVADVAGMRIYERRAGVRCDAPVCTGPACAGEVQ